MALLCENPYYKDNAPRCTLMIQDQKGAVASYNNALVKISTFDGLLNITVEDSADSWVCGPKCDWPDHPSATEWQNMCDRAKAAEAKVVDLQGRNAWQVGKIRQLDQERDAAMAFAEFAKAKIERLTRERNAADRQFAALLNNDKTVVRLAEECETFLRDVRRAYAERDEAQREVLRLDATGGRKYAADLEARIESVVVTLEEAMTSGGNWVHVNQALKIAKGKL